MYMYQAHNQLDTPGMAKSFLRGVKIFQLCPIAGVCSFIVCLCAGSIQTWRTCVS